MTIHPNLSVATLDHLTRSIGCHCSRCTFAGGAAWGIVERWRRGERGEVADILREADPATLFAVAAILGASNDLGSGLSELHHLMMSAAPAPALALELTPMNRIG